MLELPADVTYSALQDIINKAVSVPPERQKIRLGFPPRELKAPAIEDEGSKVPLQHGDKLTLDIVPEAKSATPGGNSFNANQVLVFFLSHSIML